MKRRWLTNRRVEEGVWRMSKKKYRLFVDELARVKLDGLLAFLLQYGPGISTSKSRTVLSRD